MEGQTVPLAKVVMTTEVWPRERGDPDRVEMFMGLIEAGECVPPVEVVPLSDGRFLVADGFHRVEAHRRLGRVEIEVVTVAVGSEETAKRAAYRHALETATRSALPLTKAERRRAVYGLLDERSDLSHRAIAKLVGISHQTVDRWAVERGRQDDAQSVEEAVVERRPSVDDVARRLVRYAGQLDEARGFLDLVAGGRMGKHLAKAFANEFGEEAAAHAKRSAEWFAAAARLLGEEGVT
jgi:ParB-like chromosome segregation protein Spo0J